jgi:predicted NBD/HSP70 family sugar kinase
MTGHLNPLCSSQGFVRLAIGYAAQDDIALAAVSEATGGRVESITASRIVALAGSGVEALRDLVRKSADALGLALARLSLAVDPAVIILGGPLGRAGGLFIEWTQERMAAELRQISTGAQAPRLVSASLEPQSALTGAWLLGNKVAKEDTYTR